MCVCIFDVLWEEQLTATSTRGSSSGVSASDERRPARAPGDPLELPVTTEIILLLLMLQYMLGHRRFNPKSKHLN